MSQEVLFGKSQANLQDDSGMHDLDDLDNLDIEDSEDLIGFETAEKQRAGLSL